MKTGKTNQVSPAREQQTIKALTEDTSGSPAVWYLESSIKNFIKREKCTVFRGNNNFVTAPRGLT